MIHSKKIEKIPGIPEKYAASILNIFRIPCEIILFGSRAKGSFREGSDIDLAIKGEGLSFEQRDSWLTKYEALDFPWKLDLVIYDLIEEPALKAHIDRVGRSIGKHRKNTEYEPKST